MPGRFERALQQREEATEGATEEFREFDPREAAERSARAQFETFREDLGEDFERLRGRQVGAGRLRTGFGFEDQDRFLRDRLDRLDRALAGRAVQTARLRQNQLGRAAGIQGRTLGLLERRAAQKRRKKGGLGGAIGSIVGGAAGALPFTPFDPSTGALIGGGAGRGFAGLF